jgi:hypothetical protein
VGNWSYLGEPHSLFSWPNTPWKTTAWLHCILLFIKFLTLSLVTFSPHACWNIKHTSTYSTDWEGRRHYAHEHTQFSETFCDILHSTDPDVYYVSPDILITVNMNIIIFLAVTQCNLVHRSQCYGGTCCIHLRGEDLYGKCRVQTEG